MQTRRFGQYDLSLLMLGTVQWGMPYGIANRQGQPGPAQVREILAEASEAGVNCLDTAAAYGGSEEVIGQALQELGLHERIVIVTKVRPLTPAEHANPAAAAAAIRDCVHQSLRRLRVERIPIVLFHREADVVFLDVLEDMKRNGVVGHVGTSCGQPMTAAAAQARLEALQVAINLLDRRHLRSKAFAAAATRGAAIFVRSVYLQGLLLMDEPAVPKHLRAVIPPRQRLAKLAEEAGMSLAELALRYVLSQSGVTCVVTGLESLEQLRQNVRMVEQGPLEAELTMAVDSAAVQLPDEVITPALWPSR